MFNGMTQLLSTVNPSKRMQGMSCLPGKTKRTLASALQEYASAANAPKNT